VFLGLMLIPIQKRPEKALKGPEKALERLEKAMKIKAWPARAPKW